MSDDEGALRDGAQADDEILQKLADTGRAGLDGARFQHPVAPPEEPRGEHSLRGFQGPLHLLVDSIGIKVEGEASGTRASMVGPNGASGARFTLGSMNKRWISGRSRSLGATSAMRRCCLTFWAISRPTRRLAA